MPPKKKALCEQGADALIGHGERYRKRPAIYCLCFVMGLAKAVAREQLRLYGRFPPELHDIGTRAESKVLDMLGKTVLGLEGGRC